MFAVLERSEPVAHGIVTYWFRPEKPFDFVAGEYTELYLPHNADNRGERRWFTISSSPAQALFSITTKFAANNGSSFKRAMHTLQPGARLHFSDPMGDFVLPKSKDIPLLFVAVGAGITPVHSMVQYLTDNHEKRNAQLLYGVRDENELVFADLFKTYFGAAFTPVVSSPDSQWQGETGRISATRILQALNGASNTLVYMSGPEQLIESLQTDLIKNGLAPGRIVTDNFLGYTAA